MHIAAVMAALRVDDLDHMAKTALVVVCCRANRHTAAVEVSAGRVGQDLVVHRQTATAALGRVVEAGYLAVDKHPGKKSVWRVNLSKLELAPVEQLSTPPVEQLSTTEDSLEEKRGRRGAQAPNGQVNGNSTPTIAERLAATFAAEAAAAAALEAAGLRDLAAFRRRKDAP